MQRKRSSDYDKNKKQDVLMVRGDDQDSVTFRFRQIKQAVKEQQKVIDQQFYERIPYMIGYGLIALILVIFFVRACVISSNESQQTFQSFEKQSIDCLNRYSAKKCQVNENTDQCQSYLRCIKRRNSGLSFFGWISSALSLTLKGISDQAIGFIMLSLAGLMIKLVYMVKNYIRDAANP